MMATMTRINALPRTPMDLSLAFDARLNASDLDGLVALLAPDAVGRTPEGDPLDGPEAIRAVLADWIAWGARLEGRTRQILAGGDAALLIVDWDARLTAVPGTPAMTGTAANLATRDAGGGGWRIAVLNPSGTT